MTIKRCCDCYRRYKNAELPTHLNLNKHQLGKGSNTKYKKLYKTIKHRREKL